MTGGRRDGPSEEDRLHPGSTEPNPTGSTGERPAEGGNDNPPPDDDSPRA